MIKTYVVIDEKDKYLIEYNEARKKHIFKKDVFAAEKFKDKNEALYMANFLKEYYWKENEDKNFKVCEVVVKVKILN